MRILVVGCLFPDSFTRNVAVTLEALGHHVSAVSAWRPPDGWPYALRIGLGEAIRRGWVGSLERPLLRAAAQFEPDVVLNCHWDLSPAVVARLRQRTRATVVAWFPDHPVNLKRQYLLAAPYDALFFKATFLAEFVRTKLGRSAFYLPECCNPLWHRRVQLTDAERSFYGCDLATAGSLYYYRALVLEPFANYDLKLWGAGYPPWLHSPLRRCWQNRFVAEEEKAKAFAAARIVLNTLHPAEIGSVNARLFEVAGCGGFQICEYRDCLGEFFEPETEVVSFRTRQELKEKVNYYLAHEAERQVIADRAYARAHREHTYELRLNQLLSLATGLHG